jgi:hypothetical protein
VPDQASSIDDSLAGCEPLALADYERERAVLEQRSLAEHGIAVVDVDEAVRRGVPPCTDPFVERWIVLQAVEPYVRGGS